MDGPQVDQEFAEMQDRGSAFAPDPLAGARDAGPHWLEVRESQMPDGSAVETLHGTPEMVAAWAYPPVSGPVAYRGGPYRRPPGGRGRELAGAVHRGAR